MEKKSGGGVFNQRREGWVEGRRRDGLKDGGRRLNPLQMDTAVERVGIDELDIEMAVTWKDEVDRTNGFEGMSHRDNSTVINSNAVDGDEELVGLVVREE